MRRLLILCLVLFSSLWLQARQTLVSGIVCDTKGEPVPLATITVKGSARSTAADNNGYFSIPARPTDSLVSLANGYGQGTGSRWLFPDATAGNAYNFSTNTINAKFIMHQPNATTLRTSFNWVLTRISARP